MIATPGRLIDLLGNKLVKLDKLRTFVMDEVDNLLGPKDFVRQVQEICGYISNETQMCIFSATINEKILEQTAHFMPDDSTVVKILLEPEELTLAGIKQYYMNVREERFKLIELNELYKKISIGQCIIYVNEIQKGEYLYRSLTDNGHTVGLIHSSLPQNERNKIMREFRTGGIRILISTDLLARGIDVQQVSIIINYDLPREHENYLHRIGRSGRYGRKGYAINLITKYDKIKLQEIVNEYDIQIEEITSCEELKLY
jgi:translation initiation factor 4A